MEDTLEIHHGSLASWKQMAMGPTTHSDVTSQQADITIQSPQKTRSPKHPNRTLSTDVVLTVSAVI